MLLHCGVPGLRNSGFAQSDVTYWAATGTSTMEGRAPSEKPRTIATLVEEHIHLVALVDSGINGVSDLKVRLLDVGHSKGKTITLQRALSGVGVPLHPGAKRFYREAGLLK